MTVPSVLADRLVEQLFKPRRVLTPQELEAQTPPRPPHSVQAQLAEGRRQRLESRRLLRSIKRF